MAGAPGWSPGSGPRVSPLVGARAPELRGDPAAGSLATGGCGRRGRGGEGRGVDGAVGGGHSGTSPRGRRRAAIAPVTRGLRARRGAGTRKRNAKSERHLLVAPLLSPATTRLRPPRATELRPASSHLAGLAAGPLKETRASRDVAAPGLRQPGGWGREAVIVIQPDLRPGIDARPLGQWTVLRPSAAAAKSRVLFPVPPVWNNLRN